MQECPRALQPGVSNHWTRIWDWNSGMGYRMDPLRNIIRARQLMPPPAMTVFIHWTTSGVDHWMTGTSTSSHADNFYWAPPPHWDGTSLLKPDPHMFITHSCSHNTTKNKHDTLQNLEATDMLPVTHTSLVMCHVIYFSSAQHGSLLALMYPKYYFFATFCPWVHTAALGSLCCKKFPADSPFSDNVAWLLYQQKSLHTKHNEETILWVH